MVTSLIFRCLCHGSLVRAKIISSLFVPRTIATNAPRLPCADLLVTKVYRAHLDSDKSHPWIAVLLNFACTGHSHRRDVAAPTL